MNDILTWMVNLPTYFLPIAESIIDFFNTPFVEVFEILNPNSWFSDLIIKITEFVLEQFGLNITIFDALMGGGIILTLTITIVKWFLDLIN